MEGLDFDGILGEAEVNAIFSGSEETTETETQKTPSEEKENNKEQEETTEVTSVEDLFNNEEPESVGSEVEHKEKEDTQSKKAGSPNTYSSIAKAFADEGIFPDLEDDEVEKIDSAESLRAAIDKQIQAGLDEKQKRIDQALNYGVEASEIKKYEQTLNYLDSLKDDVITAEDTQGENLRKQLIYQDFVNRGYNKDRALKMGERSFNAGTDIDDAKEALKSNRDFFQDEYDSLIEEAKKTQEKEEIDRKEQAEKLKKSILEDKKFFGEIEVDKTTRQKVFDNISKPVWKDPETGEYYTALQKYEMDNHSDFMKNVGLLFTLTDGFKSLDKLVKGKVKKEVGKGLKGLEHVLNTTSRDSNGNLKFVSGIQEDPESFIGKGIKLDL